MKRSDLLPITLVLLAGANAASPAVRIQCERIDGTRPCMPNPHSRRPISIMRLRQSQRRRKKPA